ncbi:glycosyltransferase family 2 protein [Gelidibacter sp. F2691]|nr:glycosyltransferase family 2 protein [Gelidibacter sp. F2691]
MRHSDLSQFLKSSGDVLSKGPVALIFVEDLVEVESTIQHHQDIGFRQLLVFAPDALKLPADMEDAVHRIAFNTSVPGAVMDAVNQVIEAAPGTWLYYCYNAEYLFHPFCESRTVGELLAFQTEERRDAILSYVVDLYADDLEQFPNAVSIENAHLDKSGYYANGRKGPDGNPHERQLDFYGGLRWRFEEHVPANGHKIDRVSLFRAKPGLKLRDNHTFNDEEYNTYSCPWHHNVTVAITSFRTAKALKTNAGSKHDIPNFKWHNTTKFQWNSQQLLDLGLMEPGQWF